MSRRRYVRRLAGRRYRRRDARGVALAAAAGLALAVLVHAGTGHAGTGTATAAAPRSAAAKAIAWARGQLGCPYTWGGTGPCQVGYDCSGLLMDAWAAAGVSIPRTSQEQWAALPHVPASEIEPGDLVFGPGGDGTWAQPGHVMMIISLHPARVIEAYATGTPVMTTSLSDGSAAMGGTVGYARP